MISWQTNTKYAPRMPNIPSLLSLLVSATRANTVSECVWSPFSHCLEQTPTREFSLPHVQVGCDCTSSIHKTILSSEAGWFSATKQQLCPSSRPSPIKYFTKPFFYCVAHIMMLDRMLALLFFFLPHRVKFLLEWILITHRIERRDDAKHIHWGWTDWTTMPT